MPRDVYRVSVSLFAAVLLASVWLAAEEKKSEPKVNINTATVEELDKLPGVGKSLAQRIVNHREKSGKFRTVEELLVIRGISRKKLEQLRPLVTVETEEKAGKD